MGTLFYPNPRKNCAIKDIAIEKEIDFMKKISKKKNISLEKVIEIRRILEERRKNDLFVLDRKTWDEQIAGIGEILEKIYLNFEWSVD